MEILINKLKEHPELADKAVQWFHEKWGIPKEAYEKSIADCIKGNTVPQWYVVMEEERIIAGLGVIENDFHDRLDLTPNVCAVYVEKTHRGQGIAREMLDFASRDMAQLGINTLYLVTDHSGFYEKYGWEFLCMAQGEGEVHLTRVYRHIERKNAE